MGGRQDKGRTIDVRDSGIWLNCKLPTATNVATSVYHQYTTSILAVSKLPVLMMSMHMQIRMHGSLAIFFATFANACSTCSHS